MTVFTRFYIKPREYSVVIAVQLSPRQILQQLLVKAFIKMNSLLVICLVLAASVHAKPAEHYTDRYDNINLDEILSNKRLLEPYIKCTLDQGKCSPDGKELKSHIKEALENYCEKCTGPQREGTRKVIAHLINKESAYWNQLSAKYDADKKYAKKYESELKTVQS